jgi:hypothetical protein
MPDRKANPRPAVQQITGKTDQACPPQPFGQFLQVLEARQWLQCVESCRRVRAIRHSQARNAGIVGHLQIVRRIANHQCAHAVDRQLIEQFFEHLRVWFGKTLVGAPRRVKIRAQPTQPQGALQTMAALAGRHGEPGSQHIQINPPSSTFSP